ncbi:hypothetical protein F5884DRAFT_530220 [Xylogone sp. PMI_703]|nr:hypothetical protein F5884DRAFT_530220 [Xylogone sp. PMI_703]
MACQDYCQKYPPQDFLDCVERQSCPGEKQAFARAHQCQLIPYVPKDFTIPSISSYNMSNGYAPNPRVHQPPVYVKLEPGAYKNGVGCVQRCGGNSLQQIAFKSRPRAPIACIFCRRRKIRCSGFEHNPEGRCLNCQRFQQQCIFAPVSSQSQAFVPAHVVYPGMCGMAVGSDGRLRPMPSPQPTELFGAHGQPLGTPPLQAAPCDDYPAPSPTSSHSSSSSDRTNEITGRKRPRQDSHAFILPPPIPGEVRYRRAISRRSPIEYDLKPTETTATTVAGAGLDHSSGSRRRTISLRPLSQPAPRRRDTLPRSNPSNRPNPMSLDSIIGKEPNAETKATSSDD